jgi:hypothetical protein
MNPTRPRLALAGVLSVLVLTGCSGGGGGGTTTTGSAGADSLELPAARDGVAEPAEAGGTGGVGTASVVEQQAVIKKGEIAVRTPDPQGARDGVDTMLARLHGSVDDERTVYDKSGGIRESQLVLRVPVASFGSAMDELEQLGTVVHSSSSAEDVTTQVIDVQQRLRTLRISLRDLNSFQRRATDIDQLLRFESAITQRRGEYQSLKAQRNHLVGQAARSTISLDLAVPAVPAPEPAAHRAGFLTGLHHGWTALTGTVVVLLTAVGAVLPFALVLLLLGLPLWWGWRHLGQGHRTPTPVAADGSSED